MRGVPTNRVLASVQYNFRKDIQKMFRKAVDEMTALLQREADSNGFIPANRQLIVREQIRVQISRLFTVNERAFLDDGVTPVSYYAELLNTYYTKAVEGAVFAQYKWMKDNVPEDIFNYLATSPTQPLPVSEMVDGAERIFRPNLYIDTQRTWVPMHTWKDPNGYTLSDRIWATDQETRRAIDGLLAKGLSEGKSALNLSKALEAYLVPTQTGSRTLKPYGKKYMPDGASYPALRLARTELSRAYNGAAFTSAYLNPYVGGWDWKLSASHPQVDVCDTIATIGMGGERLRPPYALESAQVPPAHPNCLCTGLPYVTDDPKTVTAQLRERLQKKEVPTMTPAQMNTLVQWLLGALNYVKVLT
jgi:hypothetical protein